MLYICYVKHEILNLFEILHWQVSFHFQRFFWKGSKYNIHTKTIDHFFLFLLRLSKNSYPWLKCDNLLINNIELILCFDALKQNKKLKYRLNYCFENWAPYIWYIFSTIFKLYVCVYYHFKVFCKIFQRRCTTTQRVIFVKKIWIQIFC